jgi:hypothetical protein
MSEKEISVMKSQITFIYLIVFLLMIGANAQTGYGQPGADLAAFKVTLSNGCAGIEKARIYIAKTSNDQLNGKAELLLPNCSEPDAPLRILSNLTGSGFEAGPGFLYSLKYIGSGGDAQAINLLGTIAISKAENRAPLFGMEQTVFFFAKRQAGTGAVDPPQERWVIGEHVFFLDDEFAYQYHFIARYTHTGKIWVIMPGRQNQMAATVSDRGAETTEVSGRQLTLMHLVVRLSSGEEHHAWVDAQNRVFKVEIPYRGYKAERQ